MEIETLNLDGVQLLRPHVYKDNRGFFTEMLNLNHLRNFTVKQINQSISKKNVFRGFHFQQSPEEQAKYIWVESGAILDIVINIQPDSKEYKKHIIVELNDQNNCHLFIPKGFAHGFISIHDNSKVCYVVDNFYSSKYDSGINYKDESLEIEWPINVNDLIVSEKDQNLPFL